MLFSCFILSACVCLAAVIPYCGCGGIYGLIYAAAGGMINYAAAYGNGGAAASYYYCSLRPVE